MEEVRNTHPLKGGLKGNQGGRAKPGDPKTRAVQYIEGIIIARSRRGRITLVGKWLKVKPIVKTHQSRVYPSQATGTSTHNIERGRRGVEEATKRTVLYPGPITKCTKLRMQKRRKGTETTEVAFRRS